MIRMKAVASVTSAAAILLALQAPTVYAQGKIVCWKDASGKVVGCGDKVPAEFAGNSTKELDKQGNVRKSSESAEQVAKRQAQEKEEALARDAERKRNREQKRQDDALLNTFTNEKEIDLKRDREVRALDNFIIQQNGALKVANDRLAEVKKRAEGYEKEKKPLPPTVKEDLTRAERDKTRTEQEIAANEKAKTETTAKYAEYRKRFMELKGIAPVAAPAAPAAPASAAATPAPAAPVAAKK